MEAWMSDTDTSAEARALIDTTRTIVRLADGKQTHVRVTTGVLTDMADTLVALMAERDEARRNARAWQSAAHTAGQYREQERSRAERAEAERDRLRGALIRAKGFIVNGVELGFIRMPDPGTPDPAHETLPAIIAALKEAGHE